MEDFIKDFKIYCEEVEDIKGLQIIKNNIFSYYLNLKLIEEYVVDEGYNFEDQIRSAKMTIYNIDKAIKEAEKVANTEYRQLYKLLYGLGKEDIKNVLEYVLSECYEFLCDKYYPSLYLYDITFKNEEVEQWYKELYKLFEKYDI